MTKPRPARLDADHTAKPRTRLVAHVPAGKKIVGHSLVERYELKDCAEVEDDGTNDTLIHACESARRTLRQLEALVDDSQATCPHPLSARRWRRYDPRMTPNQWCRLCHKVLG